MSIVPLKIGSAPNDGTGQDLRSGGQVINANFSELDSRTAEAQAKADKGVTDAARAQAKADSALPRAAVGVSVAQLVDGLVPASQLPSFVDDVLEFPAREDFPAVGESGKIYIAINDGDSSSNPTRQWRWGGATYVLIPSSPGSTDQVPEGPTNLYFTAARVRLTLLTGMGALVNAAILAGDTVLQAFAKLQGQLNAKLGKSETAADSSRLDGQPASFYTAIMAGATSSSSGTKGLVPAPAAGDQAKVLSGAGTYIDAGGAGLPVGAVIPWTLSEASIPGGMIPRNGQLLSRATWPQLWTLVSSQAVTDAVWLAAPYDQRGKYSSGDGSTTFRMPDDNAKSPDGKTIAAVTYRGYGAGSAGEVGKHQQDQVQGYRSLVRAAVAGGLVDGQPMTMGVGGAGGPVVFGGFISSGWSAATGPQVLSGAPVTDGTNGPPRIGSETRMVNSTAIWVTVGASTTSNPGTVDVTALATQVTAQQSKLDALPITKESASTGYSWVAGADLTLTHTLGSTPKTVQIELVFIAAANGMPVGGVIEIGSGIVAVSTTYYNVEIRGKTANTVVLKIGASGIYTASATGVPNVVTTAQAQIRVRVQG